MEKLNLFGNNFFNQPSPGILCYDVLETDLKVVGDFPVGGIIREVRIISDEEAAGGIATWDETNQRYRLDSSEPGWQSIETRGCVIIDTEEFGLVALLPIGMSQICSVNFEKNIQEGIRVKKGDMLGNFLFGGSVFIMIFQKRAEFVLETWKAGNSGQSNQHLQMGEKYGVLTGSGE